MTLIKPLSPRIMTSHATERWALIITYNGAAFHGWQTQPGQLLTVQRALETALSSIAGENITLTVAGRTDTGVHATGQVAHFVTHAKRPPEAWVRGVNSRLDYNIRVLQAFEVTDHFHARFSATSRRYRYLLYTSATPNPILRGRFGWTHRALDLDIMARALQMLKGEHDFSAFRSSHCQAKSPVRTLYELKLSGTHDLMAIDLHGNAFLHNMVRNIVGALVCAGSGKITLTQFASLLTQTNRLHAPPTFMADGLYLSAIHYPEQFGVPAAILPAWLYPDLPTVT